MLRRILNEASDGTAAGAARAPKPARRAGRGEMKRITLDLTSEELRVLLALASDQLFRRQFIDPKMPGHRSNAEELSLCKALVGRLQLLAEESKKQTAGAL
jgi:hypothetical protein